MEFHILPGVSALFTNMPALISSPDSMVSFLEVVGLHLPSTPVVSMSECHSLAVIPEKPEWVPSENCWHLSAARLSQL